MKGERREGRKLLIYHSPHTSFFIMHAYVAFKPFFEFRIEPLKELALRDLINSNDIEIND